MHFLAHSNNSRTKANVCVVQVYHTFWNGYVYGWGRVRRIYNLQGMKIIMSMECPHKTWNLNVCILLCLRLQLRDPITQQAQAVHTYCSGVCTPSTLLCPSLTATQWALVCLHLSDPMESVGYQALVSKYENVWSLDMMISESLKYVFTIF